MADSLLIAHNPDRSGALRIPSAQSIPTPRRSKNRAEILFISGQFGIAPDGHLGADFAAQCEQAMDNVESLLAAADMNIANLVKLTYYATRATDFAELVQIRQRRWALVPAPSVTAIAVVALARPEYLIEIEAVAVARRSRSHEQL